MKKYLPFLFTFFVIFFLTACSDGNRSQPSRDGLSTVPNEKPILSVETPSNSSDTSTNLPNEKSDSKPNPRFYKIEGTTRIYNEDGSVHTYLDAFADSKYGCVYMVYENPTSSGYGGMSVMYDGEGKPICSDKYKK